MITYEKLSARPAAFVSLCGFTLAEFEPSAFVSSAFV